ncbi:sensor histidine kinase [Paenibacillus flagellatus]|uniref:histidine kinase n=1 Tax=Paenibacillus flagellatus TaxID=2211139 RepID=A0A2V5K648_9BACL|nr:HAMP domain-containing sensor histidine kinase [Paenibacillus flagellatus]PYI53394.1 sensor histidine kinase [Paenibacillus flagellatus]
MKLGIRFKLIATLTAIIIVPAVLMSISGVREKHTDPIEGALGLNFMFLIGILLMAFVICAYLLVRVITRRILLPLKELNAAAEQIMNGNLDVEIRNRYHDEMGRFCSAFDVMRARLKESLDRQAAYERSRNELIANISHDLRTPITSIRGYVEGLQDGIARDEQKVARYLTVIKNKTDLLDRLIEDLFQFSQLESGQLVMDIREQDSREFLEAMIAPFEMELHDTAIVLNVERPFPSRPIQVDRDRMAQVFENIIENAKKYAGNSAEVTISTRDEADCIRIVIRDNGIGISEEDTPYLFERFYRGEKSRSRAFGGAGLGLAICKRIVEEHGGHIGVQSKPGSGAEFFLTLPVVKVD